MGMDLVPVYAGEEVSAAGGDDAILIDPAVQNNIGVRTAPVRRVDFHEDVTAVGYIQPVDDLTAVVDVRSEGWIEDLRIASVGDPVEAGELLFRMYAPEIVAAQSEFLQARRIGRSQLVSASRQRLSALGMTDAQIESVARAGRPSRLVDVRASRNGIVVALSVREGSHVQPGASLMTIADLSEIWVMADVFEDEATQLETGLAVQMRPPSRPGEVREGVVEYIYPTVDPRSRTVPVRMRFENESGDLRPDSFVNVTIRSQPRPNVLTVPREAIIRTGQSERVILAEPGGRFRPARIVAGPTSSGRTEILEGLAEGEQVVVSSQFLIDSEASLRGAMLRMSPPGATEEPGEPAPIWGEGIAGRVMADHGMIEVDHERIEAIGMPPMQMMYFTEPDVDLSMISAGDRLRFRLIPDEEDVWHIAEIAHAATEDSVSDDMSGHENMDMDMGGQDAEADQ